MKRITATLLSLFLLLPASAYEGADLVKASEDYFDTLFETFIDLSSSQTVRRSALRPTDRQFLRSLRANQVIYSLLRTNSKGLIVNEVTREHAPKQKFREVGDQNWYQRMRDDLEPWQSTIREEGRYYLLWAYPIVLSGDRFGGAVLAKIDLWDCFHTISAKTFTRFLAKYGNRSLYDHKWQGTNHFSSYPLDIPGTERITLRLEKEASSVATADTLTSQSKSANGEVELQKRPNDSFTVIDGEVKKSSFNIIPWVIGAILTLAILFLAIVMVRRNRAYDDIL